MTIRRSDPKPDCRFCHGAGIVSVSKDPDEIADCVCTDPPERIQQKRSKGWRMPANAMSVARPGRWGNPFTVEEFGRHEAVRRYRLMIEYKLDADPHLLDGLRGKHLACWCPLDGEPCHADVLLELANGGQRVARVMEMGSQLGVEMLPWQARWLVAANPSIGGRHV